jgi:hypothetical protein
MDINFDKVKGILAVVITVGSSLFSGILAGKHYLDTSFVSAKEFSDIRVRVTLNFLENRKYAMENRLYLLDMCSKDPKCIHFGSTQYETEKAKRELDDTRGQIEVLKRHLLSN